MGLELNYAGISGLDVKLYRTAGFCVNTLQTAGGWLQLKLQDSGGVLNSTETEWVGVKLCRTAVVELNSAGQRVGVKLCRTAGWS